MQFHDIIIKRRKELGLSQADVALSLGYTPQAISKFEKNSSSWPVTILPSLAKTLGLSINALFGYESRSETPYENKPIDTEALGKRLKKLREEKKVSLSEAAKSLGISPRSLFSYEEGSSIMGTLTFEVALHYYGVTPEELCYSDIAPAPLLKKKSKKPLIFLAGIVIGVMALSYALLAPSLINNKNDGLSSSSITSFSSSSGSGNSSVSSSASSSSSTATSSSIPSSSSSSSDSGSSSSSSSATESSSSSSSDSGSSSPSSSTSEFSSSSSSLWGDLPSSLSISRDGGSASYLGVGSFVYEAIFPDGYSLPSGIALSWKVEAYRGSATCNIAESVRGKGKLDIDEIAPGGAELLITLSLNNGSSVIKAMEYQHILDDSKKINPEVFPGLSDFLITNGDDVYFEAHRGDVFHLPITFRSVPGKTFTYSSSNYIYTVGSNSSLISSLDDSYDVPTFTFTVPSSFLIGQSIILRSYLLRKYPNIEIVGGFTIIKITG